LIISVIGHGYVGLVSASVFSDLGNTVWCVGRDPKKIAELKKGNPLFYEPGLAEVVQRNVKAGRLKFTTDYKEGVKESEIIFICVGTPPAEDGKADLTQVLKVAEEIGKNLEKDAVIVCKSTVPVGTNEKVAKIVNKFKKSNVSFESASCPEFLREGTALSDTLHPDRIVIGAETEKAVDLLTEIHKPIQGELVITNIKTAEMIKYAANSFLATKISFANAIAELSEKVGADAEKIMEGIGLDRRIGRKFLYPGVGYGGSCFPKDVKALIAIAGQYDYDFQLLKTVEDINEKSAMNFINKIINHFKGDVEGKHFAILGLAFKPNTDDMRFAPSIKIIEALEKKGAVITVFDPIAKETASKVLQNVEFADDIYECTAEKDAAIFVTEWNEFKQIDLAKLKKSLKSPIVFDGRNIYNPGVMQKMGFIYYSVGRK
jgi:UDPglucose 6-dehydrogenase